MSFRTSKRVPSSTTKEDPFEVTNIAFPSPNRDTLSYIEQTPDLRERSSGVNRFRNEKFDPTSPIYFSDSHVNSYDDDYKIFLPQSQADEGVYGRTNHKFDVKVPSLVELADSYCEFIQRNLPDPITYDDFYSRINRIKVEPIPKILWKKFISSYYYESNKGFMEYIVNETKQMEKELNDFKRICKDDPPYLLFMFYQFQEKEIMKSIQGIYN